MLRSSTPETQDHVGLQDWAPGSFRVLVNGEYEPGATFQVTGHSSPGVDSVAISRSK